VAIFHEPGDVVGGSSCCGAPELNSLSTNQERIDAAAPNASRPSVARMAPTRISEHIRTEATTRNVWVAT
jgi:hypothetical protein